MPPDEMLPDQTPESSPPETPLPQSPLRPPVHSSGFLRAIFWNDHELRAGWRLLVYVLLVILFTTVGTFLAVALHLPQISHAALTAARFSRRTVLGSSRLWRPQPSWACWSRVVSANTACHALPRLARLSGRARHGESG